ncbi:MAG TPA: nickel pincer cofactor biosynthesis protein LarB [Longimicrobiales bacterium]|nr:nickel pincer cofactor biosynthesis protein LarB [Longimicrobiales bacterium]
MNRDEIVRLLERLQAGDVALDAVVDALRAGPFRTEQLAYADLDHHRALRQGLPEVVYGEGKTSEQIVEIARRLAQGGQPILVTRLGPEEQALLEATFPGVRTNPRARTCLLNPPEVPDGEPFVGVVAAGTSDLPVAEEAVEVCLAMSVPTRSWYDVGVSGLHRLLRHVPELQRASAIVVVAGMEGALPSVVGGLVSCPVFGVPTSIGYGTSFGGVAPLLSMLNSCAPGLMVSNIDNGFSAGVAAARVVRAIRAASPSPEASP